MKSLEKGAKQAVINCMKINSNDKVVIIGDVQSKNIVDALKKESLNITKNVVCFVLEDFGKRPLLELPDNIRNSVKDSTAVFYTASSQKGEKQSLRVPIIRIAVKTGRQAHMPDINEQIMKQGMCSDYNKVQKVSKKVYNIASKARTIKVITDKGTNLTAIFSKEIKWIKCDGDISKIGKWSNLPDGEIFTCPERIDGIAIIDGCLGDYLGKKYKILEKTPIKLVIENSRIMQVECKNKELENELKEYILQDENANKIGEFAIGTNIGLKKIVGNLLQDEKFPSVHFAAGSPYPDGTNAKWDSKAHCDFVITKTTIIINNKKIMDKGKFIKQILN